MGAAIVQMYLLLSFIPIGLSGKSRLILLIRKEFPIFTPYFQKNKFNFQDE